MSCTNSITLVRLDAAWMLTRLATASCETIFHRTVLMMNGTCSAAEKMDADHFASVALMTGQGGAAAITPYLNAATTNAHWLRG